jgi:hypothetical protein
MDKYQFRLLLERSLLARLDVYPFVLGYGMLYGLQQGEWLDSLYIRLLLILTVFLNALTYIMGYWSPIATRFIQFNTLQGPFARTLPLSGHVQVTKIEQNISVTRICELFREED